MLQRVWWRTNTLLDPGDIRGPLAWPESCLDSTNLRRMFGESMCKKHIKGNLGFFIMVFLKIKPVSVPPTLF